MLAGCVTTLVVDDTEPGAPTDDGGSMSSSQGASTSASTDATDAATTVPASSSGGDLDTSGSDTGPVGPCIDDLVECDGLCIDVMSNGLHCGDCMRQCDDTEKCVGGQCVCRPGLTDCGTGCTDTRIDPFNCGTCGNDCGVQLCGDFECIDSCDDVGMQCAQSCVDLDTNPLHCSECGHPCHTNQDCLSGDCETPGD